MVLPEYLYTVGHMRQPYENGISINSNLLDVRHIKISRNLHIPIAVAVIGHPH